MTMSVDGRPAEGQSLRLGGVETLEGGMVWLRYQVERHERRVTVD
jgi:hypothetical protein